MKKTLLLLSYFCFISNIYGQKVIQYNYDNSGNRIKREIVVTQNAVIDKLSETLSEHEIQIYTNPDKDSLSINISNIDGSNKTFLTLYNASGTILKNYIIKSTQSNIDISNKMNDIYLMKITIDEEEIIWKIIKV